MPHPAIQSFPDVSADILPSVFDWFFSYSVYKQWLENRKSWQLHCIGGPGTGKTTLTTLIYQRLKQDEKTKDHPVVLIHINRDVPSHDLHFLEDFLNTIYLQLGDQSKLDVDDSKETYSLYARKFRSDEEVAPEGSAFKERLRLLRRALHMRIEYLVNMRTFILLDGLDRCSPTIRMMIDDELFNLSTRGMSIFLTSRIAVFEQGEVRCDHWNHGDVEHMPQDWRAVLTTYLECTQCEDILCFECRKANRLCRDGHDASNLIESYDHVNVRLSIPEKNMKDFIAWELEREHGDLGLGSNADKPPLSPLGGELVSPTSGRSVQKHANDVFDSAGGHIGLARARLDVIHGSESLDNIEARRDQLPPNIVTLFDSGLKGIENQPVEQRDIALAAIAATASHIRGIDIPELRNQLKALGTAETRSGEDILEATKGWLLATMEDDPQQLAAFHQSFFYYIADRYHRGIHRASLQIDTQRVRFEPQNVASTPERVTPQKIARSTTMQVIKEESFQPFIIRKGTRAWQ